MGKVIQFLILATFFLSSDAFSQSKISNPPTPPPQANHNDDYNSENRFNDFRSDWYRKAQIKSEGIKYNEEGLKPYLDDNYINLLKDLFEKKLERFPECVQIDLCTDIQTERLNNLVGKTYSPRYKESPVYPTRAMESGTHGYVIVAFDINKKGAVENVYKVESSCTLANGQIQKNCEVFDRATMSSSIEMRAPFMDYRLLQIAFSLRDNEKIGELVTYLNY